MTEFWGTEHISSSTAKTKGKVLCPFFWTASLIFHKVRKKMQYSEN